MTTLSLVASIEKRAKGEDCFFEAHDEKHSIYTVGVIDGATGLNKRILPDGREKILPQTAPTGKSYATIWATLLKDEIPKHIFDMNLSLVDVVKQTLKCIDFPYPLTDKIQTPSAALLIVRLHRDILEVCSMGDCGITFLFQSGTTTTCCGNVYLENMRQEREQQIKINYPDFEHLSPIKQAKIRYQYMIKTRESLGQIPGYFVPFVHGDKALTAYTKISHTKHGQGGILTSYHDGMFWTFQTIITPIQKIMLFTDGLDLPVEHDASYMTRVLTSAAPQRALEKMTLLAEQLSHQNPDPHATATRQVNGIKPYPYHDDMTGLILQVNKDKG